MSTTLVAVFIGLLIAAIPLVGLANRWQVPYPIVLVIGGLVLGFVPWLPRVDLNPDLVLLVFLPPLLYWEAVTAPTDEMRANAVRIWPLAIGLVLATTAGVAAVMHALIPALPWAVALTFGAIVAPTDELASVPIAERLGVPRKTTAIVDGEALLNDAGSLVLYTTAVAAAVAGTFSPGAAIAEFVLAAVGAVVLGLIAGRLAVEAWKRIDDTRLQAVVSVLLPFIAYAPADHLKVSGVLAVVTAGVYVNRYTPLVITPSARIQTVGWWETTVFLINVVAFILVGMQLHHVVGAALAAQHGWVPLVVDALAVNVTLIVLRFAWVFGQAYVLAALSRRRPEPGTWKQLVVTAVAGFRGVVSLAAALAIPLTVAGGAHFPDRELLIFLTFSVILVTLVIGGLTMPSLIAALRIPAEDVETAEERAALRQTAQAALRRLDELERDGHVAPDQAGYLRARYGARRDRYGAHDGNARDADDALALERLAVERELIAAQRRRLVEMRRNGRLENQVLRRVQLTLDLAESELQRTFNAGNALEESSELATVPLPESDALRSPAPPPPAAS